MKPEEIKAGMLVWWKDDRYGLSCPGIIDSFENNVAHITTFHNFTQNNCSRLDNLRPASLVEIVSYIRTRITYNQNEINSLTEEIAMRKSCIAQYEAKLNELTSAPSSR